LNSPADVHFLHRLTSFPANSGPPHTHLGLKPFSRNSEDRGHTQEVLGRGPYRRQGVGSGRPALRALIGVADGKQVDPDRFR